MIIQYIFVSINTNDKRNSQQYPSFQTTNIHDIQHSFNLSKLRLVFVIKQRFEINLRRIMYSEQKNSQTFISDWFAVHFCDIYLLIRVYSWIVMKPTLISVCPWRDPDINVGLPVKGLRRCTASVIGFILVVREFVREWGRFGAGLTYGNDPVFLFPAIELRRIARILFLRRIFAVLYSAVGTHTASYAVWYGPYGQSRREWVVT
jgi:hypothetical protein